MQLATIQRIDRFTWEIPPYGDMKVPARILASQKLLDDMDDKVHEQLCNVASLPGIVGAALAMPDAHWGYGFPIGGVAAFDAAAGGVISAGGVGFDISCGVRTLLTGLRHEEVMAVQTRLADALYAAVPAGVGSRGEIRLDDREMEAMLLGGAQWAVARGHGTPADLDRVEERGCVPGARPECVSRKARERQREEMGTLGSGNHYLEVQRIASIQDAVAADAFGLRLGEVVVSIHSGSRGMGHQVGTEYMQRMAAEAHEHGIRLPDRELACAPILSKLGQEYLGAMRAATHCALANRQILTAIARHVFACFWPQLVMPLLYDVSHNTCKTERHLLDGLERELHVHRKGATRAFGPGHPDLPPELKGVGQPVFIGGSMGTPSYVLAGTTSGMQKAFGSACHGAGRAMSRCEACKTWTGSEVLRDLAERGIQVRSPTSAGVAEEAPGAYKDVTAVCNVAQAAGLARIVARLEPLLCLKG